MKKAWIVVLLVIPFLLSRRWEPISLNDYEAVELQAEVKGAVELPGVYSIDADETVQELLERAGGCLATADLSALNLNASVTHQSVLVVPEKQTGSDKVSLNTATLEELMTLKGVGETKALRIIEYREQHQGFKTIEEIMNVKGIGEKSFEKMKDQLAL